MNADFADSVVAGGEVEVRAEGGAALVGDSNCDGGREEGRIVVVVVCEGYVVIAVCSRYELQWSVRYSGRGRREDGEEGKRKRNHAVHLMHDGDQYYQRVNNAGGKMQFSM